VNYYSYVQGSDRSRRTNKILGSRSPEIDTIVAKLRVIIKLIADVVR